MSQLKGFEIHYHFMGEHRHFLHQGLLLCDSEAMHFAALHAGVGSGPGYICAGPVRLAIQQAEGVGVTNVQWKQAG